MFNNAIKKFAAVGLVFSLCVPCCFASAQPGKKNGGVDSSRPSNTTYPTTVGELFDSLMERGATIGMSNDEIMNSAEELRICIFNDDKPFELVTSFLSLLGVNDGEGLICAISICEDAGYVINFPSFL